MSGPERESLKYDVRTHFKFGENWGEFSGLIDEDRIGESVRDLRRLLGMDSLTGKTFLDIGCGSGLSSLAALRMGAGQVTGFDIDGQSVETARSVLTRFSKRPAWKIERLNVLESDAARLGRFDVVYSWGVLHHSGDLWQSIAHSTQFVTEGGLFAIALYRKTPLCGAWRAIKRVYSRTPPAGQRVLFAIYVLIYMAGLLATLRNPRTYIRNYGENRGMNFFHDAHDWLGGYPYQSAHPEEVMANFQEHGFTLERKFTRKTRLWGFFGTGCDEFLFRKSPP